VVAGRGTWKTGVTVVATVVLMVSGLPATAMAQSVDNTTVEYALAVAQTGRAVASNDPLVLAYGNVLDRVQLRCNENRVQLGSIALALADKVNRESAYTATPLSLLLGLDAAATPDVYGPDNPANCGELLGVVAYLASQGD
jgi:hypothetical protein